MKIHLSTLGCRLNEAELESWSREFGERGHRLSDDPRQADLVVVNTCAVTDEAVRKSRKLLRRVQRDNPAARLVVSGCYASLNPAESRQLPGVDLVIDNRDKPRLVELVSAQLALPVMPESAIEPGENSLFSRGRQRAFIKVQDGCRYRCSFCIVTHARGEERSRPAVEVIEEINALHREGVQEVVLAGVHLGGYGSETGSDIGQLVAQVLRATDIPRIRLGSLEPWDLPEGFWELFDSARLMPHLHLPLQSGADSVLRRMSRRCRTDEYRRLVTEARGRVADLNLSTDIIVGFPGETEAEWEQTLAFVEEIGFGHVHVFGYSARAGTKAASLPDPVPAELKRRRSQELSALARRLRAGVLSAQVGRRFPVLVEGDGPNAEGLWQGYTPNFLRVSLTAPATPNLSSHVVEVEIEGSDGEECLRGRLV
jgi:threonylcarbamoyladenosine tRNA methylthiotransferase MtaB